VDGITPETWPILAAFLALQTLITVPLILYIRAGHNERVADLKQQVADAVKDREAQVATIRAIYQAATDYAQRRADQLHQEKEALIKQLDGNSQQLFRAVDALAELREAVKDLTRARRSG
jgi:ABC-type transporter Mla subunit MlaD